MANPTINREFLLHSNFEIFQDKGSTTEVDLFDDDKDDHDSPMSKFDTTDELCGCSTSEFSPKKERGNKRGSFTEKKDGELHLPDR